MTRPEPAVIQLRRPLDYSSLPFDPSQIAQEDRDIRSDRRDGRAGDSVVHEEEAGAASEYDIDLDAEMAQLALSARRAIAGRRRGAAGPTRPDFASMAPQPRSQPAGAGSRRFRTCAGRGFPSFLHRKSLRIPTLDERVSARLSIAEQRPRKDVATTEACCCSRRAVDRHPWPSVALASRPSCPAIRRS